MLPVPIQLYAQTTKSPSGKMHECSLYAHISTWPFEKSPTLKDDKA